MYIYVNITSVARLSSVNVVRYWLIPLN